MTGQEIGAEEALRLGIAGEVVPLDRVLDRARQLASQLAGQTDLTLRYTRLILTQKWKRRLQADLGFGLMLAGSALNDLIARLPQQ
jgi:enoyl-CoA hydratase/carnithine racemase